MNPDKLTRRQLLASFIAGLFTWLCPEQSEAAMSSALPSLETYRYDSGGTREPVVWQTTMHFDAMGRCIKVQDHRDDDGGTTSFQYDGNGNPLS